MTEQTPQNFRILVVDDDAAILDLFRQVLSPAKTNRITHLETEDTEGVHIKCQPALLFDLVTCRQGDGAVNAVKQSIEKSRPFSAAFIDIRMPPGPDGIWTAEQIRRLDGNIEILIMTGYTDIHPQDITRRVPPVHKLLYVQKPFHIQEIYQFATALSMKWHSECELQKLNRGLEQCVEARIQEIKKVNEELQIKLDELQQSRSALKESEGKLNAMILSIPDHISMMDKELNIIWANNTAKKIFGKRIISKKCYEVYYRRKEPCEPYLCLTLKAFEDSQTHEHETQVIDKNGNIRFFHCTANVALRDENQNPTAVIKISKDITEQKLSRKALAESETRYRALAENSNVGFWQTTLDGYTLYINPAMCRMLEVEDSEELHGKTYYSFYDAENLGIVKRELAKRKKGISSTYEVELIGKKGTKRNMMISAAPIFFSKDKIHSVIGTYTDITDLKRTQKALMKAHYELEHKIYERTVELKKTLEKVERGEKELTQRELTLEKINQELLETNQALSVLARNIDRDKELLEKKIYEMISTNLMPIVEELQSDECCQRRQADLELLKTHLNSLVSGPKERHELFFYLSSQEMRVAALIKRGMTSPQISELLNISLHTVKTHRKNIRKKLKLQNSDITLSSYLKSKFRE